GIERELERTRGLSVERTLDREEAWGALQRLGRAAEQTREEVVQALDGHLAQQARRLGEESIGHVAAVFPEAEAQAPEALLHRALDPLVAPDHLQLGMLDGCLHRLRAGAAERRHIGALGRALDHLRETSGEDARRSADAGLGVKRTLCVEHALRHRGEL